MKKKLTANLGLKILAILFSVMIWFIVVNINDPVDKTVFRNVPVEILHADAVTGQGKVYEILEDTDVIDVTVWAKRSILDTLGKENIIATADMQEINFMDTMVRIKLSTNKYNDKLESITSPTENLKIMIENLKRSQFVIGTATVGEPAEGYVLGNVSTDQNLVSVSGPESYISQIARAEVAVDVSGLSQDIRTDATIRLYDSDNNLITHNVIKKSPEQVKVNIEILQMKRVPLHFAVTGVPAEGYVYTGEIECSPATVLVAGKSAVLKNIEQIDMTDVSMDITGKTDDMVTNVEIRKYLPENIVLAENDFNGIVRVTAHIEEEADREVSLSSSHIVLTGVPEGLEARLGENEVKAELCGLEEILDEIDEDQITAVIDVKSYMERNLPEGMAEGEYQMPVTLSLPEDVRQKREVTAFVVISDREKPENDN